MSAENRAEIMVAFDMLYLACCAAAGEPAVPERIQRMDMHKLYAICCYHSLTALVCEALVNAPVPHTQEYEKYLKVFCTARDRSVRKNLLLDMERRRIFSFMDQNGIWYMPLKGIVLKDMYPRMGLREMADNDILFDSALRHKVREWFERQGYEAEVYDTWNHDKYKKPPVYHYEMHVSLYGDDGQPELERYYQDVGSRMVKDAGDSCGYHFTDEDFYVYFISHGFKHYDNYGNGVRFLIDIYIYLKNKAASMDLSYVEGELEKLGLHNFERDCRALVERMFSDIQGFALSQLSAEQKAMLKYFLSCGTYGNSSVRMRNTVRKKGMLRVIAARLFPSTKVMKQLMPAVEKHAWLLPVSWIYRLIFRLPVRFKYIKEELGMIFKAK